MNARYILIIFMMLSMILRTFGQVPMDTLYYDRNWKGVESKAFASYFRVIQKSTDNTLRKPFRDYYISGEIQAEGGYISIDKYDDSHSVFDGDWVNYYKSGQIAEKGNRFKGKREGEYIRYNENGLVQIHANFVNDKLHGLYTKFSEDGNVCTQIEMYDGDPRYDYYMISNQDGLCSKVRISDKQPIYERSKLENKKVEYIKGETWQYYNENGIMVGLTNTEVKDYGKYFQIQIIISNKSMFPIEFDPNKIDAILIDKKWNERILKVYSADEYMSKVRFQQNVAMVLNAYSEASAANKAGYATSDTKTTYNGTSSHSGSAAAIGSGGWAYGTYSENSSYSAKSSSTTVSYNGAAAYQAQVIASNRIAAYEQALLAERAEKSDNYLRRTTLYPGQTLSGYVNIERRKGFSMDITIIISGIDYKFPWDLSR